MPRIEVELDRVATGGRGLGTGPDGRIVFAEGGLPGERVLVEVDRQHATRLEGLVVDVVTASPHRRPPPCPQVRRGCGGCDWQHVDPDHQRRLRRDIVVDCLRRLGHVEAPDVRLGPLLDPTGYRTTARAAVSRGRAGYRAARSHDVVTADSCLVVHPLVEELLVEGRFGSAREVTIRVGARTGDRLVLATPSAEGVRVPDGVIVVGDDELARGRRAHLHETVGGRTLRISARSFFQCRPDGAEVLVDLAKAALEAHPGPLLDAYCGVGLFGVLGGRDRQVLGVESSHSSSADAVHNYRRHLPGATVRRSRLERWRPEPASSVRRQRPSLPPVPP
jgi:tRNA/tmRNA/rRNA uracil-C5-methylase (TrmA/RlmC/RlmD family)